MDSYTSGIELAETLQRLAASRGDSRCLLLIDPLLRDPADDPEWEGLAGELAARETPVRLAHPDIDPRVWPRLIGLDLTRPRDADISRAAAGMAISDWEPAALGKGDGRRIGGWIFGAGDATALAGHLGRTLLAVRADGGRTLLRLHDPAVLDLVWRQASRRQKADLLGPAGLWVNVDRWRRLARYDIDEPRTGSAMRLDGDQWRTVRTFAAVNRAWRAVAPRAGEILPETLEQVVACVRRGAEAGLHDLRDWEAIALRALTVHPEFDQHPTVADMLAARPGDIGFSRLVMALTDADWAAIAHDCRQPSRAHIPG